MRYKSRRKSVLQTINRWSCIYMPFHLSIDNGSDVRQRESLTPLDAPVRGQGFVSVASKINIVKERTAEAKVKRHIKQSPTQTILFTLSATVTYIPSWEPRRDVVISKPCPSNLPCRNFYLDEGRDAVKYPKEADNCLWGMKNQLPNVKGRKRVLDYPTASNQTHGCRHREPYRHLATEACYVSIPQQHQGPFHNNIREHC